MNEPPAYIQTRSAAQEDAVEYLAQRGYDPAFGARPVKRVVQRELESALAKVGQPAQPSPAILVWHRLQL